MDALRILELRRIHSRCPHRARQERTRGAALWRAHLGSRAALRIGGVLLFNGGIAGARPLATTRAATRLRRFWQVNGPRGSYVALRLPAPYHCIRRNSCDEPCRLGSNALRLQGAGHAATHAAKISDRMRGDLSRNRSPLRGADGLQWVADRRRALDLAAHLGRRGELGPPARLGGDPLRRRDHRLSRALALLRPGRPSRATSSPSARCSCRRC